MYADRLNPAGGPHPVPPTALPDGRLPMPPIPGITLATGRFLNRAAAGDAEPAAANASLGDWLSARVQSRHDPSHTLARHEAGVTVLVEGVLTHVTGSSVPVDAPAAAVLALYLEAGLDFLPRLRGSYTGLILDARSNQAHLFNDRRASRPLFYREGAERSLRAGPEVAALAAAAPAVPGIDAVAVCEFLLFASYYDDRTLFPGIRSLPPASVMSLEPGASTLRRYWQVRIEARKTAADENEWVRQALVLFNQATARLLAQTARPFLYLSGGLDSRMILGSLRAHGSRIAAVSYGTTTGDDATIARQLAEHCGMPFTYFPLSTEAPQAHFTDAALRADCRAETIDTPSLGRMQDQLGASFDLFFQGDKSFYGHHAPTPDAALIEAGIFSFAQARRLGDMLDPDVYRDARRSIDRTRDALRSAAPPVDPADLRDRVYYTQRLANRQNAFTAANLRRLEQARPWLDEDLVDFLFSMPGALRTDNALTRKMLEAAHPDLAAMPFARRDSIPLARTYRQFIAAQPALGEFVRAEFGERLDPRLAALFRPGVLAMLVASLLSGQPYPTPRTHWWQALPGMWRIDARRYRADRIHPVGIVLRLMQINLYLRETARHAGRD